MFLCEDGKKSDVSLSLKLRYIFHLSLDGSLLRILTICFITAKAMRDSLIN